MKVYFSNTGCTLEVEDFMRFIRFIEAEQTKNITEADVIIAHFCALSTESFETIPPHMAVFKGLKDYNPSLKLYIGGCAAEVLNLQKRYPFVDGVFNRRNMVEDLANYFNYDPKSEKDEPMSYYHSVRIQTGCVRNCGFCKKAYLKMPLHSKPIEKVIADVKEAVKKGHHDIVLHAENATEYGIDLGNIRLIDLLKKIIQIDGVNYIYLTALCIDELSVNPELVDFIKGCNKINKVQLEIQSLIPEVRKNMRLTSSVDDVLRVLKEFSSKYIITNIMVGYPGETSSNFQKQIELIKKYELYYVQINNYDDTPLVYGHSLEQIPKNIVQERSAMLMQTLAHIRNKKATEIRIISKNNPISCVYTTERRFETLGYSAIVEVANAKKIVSGQIINVKISGIKNTFDIFDYNQSLILRGTMV